MLWDGMSLTECGGVRVVVVVGCCVYYIRIDCSADSVRSCTSDGFILAPALSLFSLSLSVPLPLYHRKRLACLWLCEIRRRPSQVDGYQNPQTTPAFIMWEGCQVMTYHYPSVTCFRSFGLASIVVFWTWEWPVRWVLGSVRCGNQYKLLCINWQTPNASFGSCAQER